MELPENTHKQTNKQHPQRLYLWRTVLKIRFVISVTLRTLFWTSAFPFSICAISSLIEMRVSQNLSNSACKQFLLSSCDTLREKNSQWRDLRMRIVPCFHSRSAQSWAFQRQGKTLWVHGNHSPSAVSPHPLLLFQQCSKEQKKPCLNPHTKTQHPLSFTFQIIIPWSLSDLWWIRVLLFRWHHETELGSASVKNKINKLDSLF